MTVQRALVRSGVLLCALACVSCRVVTPAPDAPALSLAGPDAVQVYAVGDIADCRREPPDRTAAARTAQLVPAGATVLGLGDMAYDRADTRTLTACFEPTWGRHRANMLPVPGNHDLSQGQAVDFLEYFDLAADPLGFIAYERDLAPGWRLIALDSNVSGETLQRQFEWLQRMLDGPSTRADAGSRQCLLVLWHTPLFSSGWHRGSGAHMRPFWELLDAHAADLVLSGHEHFYEAFEPMDAAGRRTDDGGGIRQFTVGTGGATLHGFWRPPYASRARVLSHGVLQLTLATDRYEWRFIDVTGRIRDAGAATCRGATPN
jgi:3',5'-cyclic AMP phosphodiesterase CpdA